MEMSILRQRLVFDSPSARGRGLTQKNKSTKAISSTSVLLISDKSEKSIHLDQFNLENQDGIGADFGACALCAVGELGGGDDAHFFAFFHHR
jgi:hypothetical protein